MNAERRLLACWAWFAVATLAGCSSELPADRSDSRAARELSGALSGGRLDFVAGYESGLSAARLQGKPMLLFFSADWCHYCQAMAAEALSDEAVVRLSDRFVCVLIDADAEPERCREFRVRAYPTVVFVAPTGASLNRLTGKQPSPQLVMEMQSALQMVARRATEPNRTR